MSSNNISGVYDSTKNYKSLQYQQGQFVAAVDFNHVQDILNNNSEGSATYMGGYFLKTNPLVNSPVLKVKANFDISSGSIITLEMTAANFVKFKVNGGAFGAPIAVTADGVTWNVVTGSGLSVIFSDTPAAADSSEIWVSRGMRMLGGELTHSAGVTYKLAEGHWLLEGRYVELLDDTVAGCNNGDYVYIGITEANIDHSVDSAIGHFLADGVYANVSPVADKKTYDLLASAVFPTASDSPYSRYIIVGKITNAAGGVFIEASNAVDLQSMYRLYADTTSPSTPTGLALSSDGEKGLITAPVGTLTPTSILTATGYLKMDCDVPVDSDVKYTEFKICRLDVLHAPTTDVQTFLVTLNVDGGGFGIPLGVSHVVHSLIIGVEYRVWARHIDCAGNLSSWCASVDKFIGDTCNIAVGAPAPTIALADTGGFVGVALTVTVMPAQSAGFTVWVGEGSYPAIASDEGLITHYPAGQGVVHIPWKESGSPFVVVAAFDDAGLYHVDAGGNVVKAQDSINLAASAQLASETHDVSAIAHSGSVADVISCQQKYGTLLKWMNLLNNQSFDLDNVYIVAEDGANYQSVQSALNGIGNDLPSLATIIVAPGNFDTGVPITFPDLTNPVSGVLETRVVIQGLGSKNCVINTDIDISTLSKSSPPISSPLYPGVAGLTLRDISVYGRIHGTKVAAPVGGLVLDNVIVWASSAINSLIKLDASAGGGFNTYIYNSYLVNFGAQPILEFLGQNEFNVEGNTFNQYTIGGVDAIYLNGLAGTIRYLKNNSIQIFNAAAGRVIESSVGATVVVMSGNTLNTAVGGNIAPSVGTIDTNTVIAGNIIAI